jgi:Tfp pilus assembly protein PilW
MPDRKRSGTRAFTMLELLIATGISSVILVGVLSAFLMIGRTGYNASSYSIMEAEARRALDTFSIEARMASNVTWTNSSSVTLTVLSSTSNYSVTYYYNSAEKAFYRVLGPAGSTAGRMTLIRDVEDFAFRRFKVVNGSDFAANNDLETKQLQIMLRTVRSRTTTVDATNAVLSARVILRNKVVST